MTKQKLYEKYNFDLTLQNIVRSMCCLLAAVLTKYAHKHECVCIEVNREQRSFLHKSETFTNISLHYSHYQKLKITKFKDKKNDLLNVNLTYATKVCSLLKTS